MTAPHVAPPAAARAVAADLKRRWRAGEPPDAAAAVAAHPELAGCKSVVLDLAYEDFLLRERTGAAPGAEAFAARFPAFRGSIRDMLADHARLVEHPELLDPGADDWPAAGTGEPFEGLDLLTELGKGSFARAYLAFDPATDRLCVLKLTAGGGSEARVIGRLAHPHVTDVYWSRPVGPRTAVCLPFVGVSTLADVVTAAFPRRGDPAPATADVILAAAETDELAGLADRRSEPVVRPGEPYLAGACAVAARVADAVAYLHREGVAHGDLKPSNVVVGPGGAPHLIDFNLAARADLPPAVRGTPAYMPPELLAAAAARVPPAGADPFRADVFSLGVVVYELLTGRLPFGPPADDFAALAAAARRGPAPLPPGVPPPVATAVLACLAADPAARPATAAPLAEALARAVRPAPRPGRPRWAAVAAAAVLLAAAAAAAAWWTPPEPKPAAAAAPRPPETADEFFARGREYLKADKPALARADFFAAHERGRKARDLAYAAFALALEGQAGTSAGVAHRAIADGAASAEVYNNLGYALTQTNKLPEARVALDRAVELDPRLPAVRYNRAMAIFRSGLNDPAGVDTQAAEDVRAALDAGLRSAALHFDAARVFAACADRDPALRAAALEQIRAAVGAGKDPEQCRKDGVLRTRLRNAPDFLAACDVPRGRSPDVVPQLRLVEPGP